VGRHVRRDLREIRKRVTRSAAQDGVSRIRRWGEACDWKGYDPYDALNSPAAPFLTLGTRPGRRALTQAVKLSPLNLRPILRIQPDWNAKAIGLVASGYARLSAAGDTTAGVPARRWLEWLAANHSGSPTFMAWGYHFDVQTRFFSYDRDTPNTIATSFVAHAFLDGVELLGDQRWGEQALAAARFLGEHMLSAGPDGTYFRYLPREDELVHNANLLACAVLARTARLLGAESLAEPARQALETSLGAQREDGAWPYAAGPAGGWVDNFHTGYVLESLAHCVTLRPDVRGRLEQGLAFWDRALFADDGTPKYFPDRTYPVDAHCYATAIATWLSVVQWHPRALQRADRLAELLIARMLDPAGFVHFQQRRLWTNRVPFVRWTTAPSFRALAGLLLHRAGGVIPPQAEEHAHSRLG
jgi:hypothetical protein